MGLLDDAKSMIKEIFGPEIAEQLDNFDNPEKYPKDFLDECVDFIGKLIGEDAAKKKFMPLMKRYGVEKGAGARNNLGSFIKKGMNARHNRFFENIVSYYFFPDFMPGI